ncbi:MAG: carboxypeptidase-like regulatory domain-containing protein [Nitrososphaerota archaeon]
MKQLAVVFALSAGFLLISSTYASGATLWDFVIKAEFEQDRIGLNDSPVIFGTILDHASKPVSGADVKIRFSGISVDTTTDSQGNFRQEFGQQLTPGAFSVSVSAKLGDKKGFATTTLRVGDEFSTFGEIYYKSQSYNAEDGLSGDPYKALKLKNYQKFIDDQNKRKQKQLNIESKMLVQDEKREVAKQRLDQAMKERPVGSGIYAGDDYERYIAGLDPRIKDTISGQLNYTRQIFEEAQYEMKVVLDNGGSLQDARKAYLAKLSTTKEELIQVNDHNNPESHSKIKKSQDSKINSKKVNGLKLNKYLK